MALYEATIVGAETAAGISFNVVRERDSMASGRGPSFRSFAPGAEFQGGRFGMARESSITARSLAGALVLANSVGAVSVSGKLASVGVEFVTEKSGTSRRPPLAYEGVDGRLVSCDGANCCFNSAPAESRARDAPAGSPRSFATPTPAATSAAATKSLRVAVTAYLEIRPTSRVASQATPTSSTTGSSVNCLKDRRAYRAVCYLLRPRAVGGSPFLEQRFTFRI
jgi:hypothetical protein